jgi:hypothetical protein
MEALERYLEAVGRHLRGARREDIVAELRANLEAQLEDNQAELGRPLTTKETEEWLKQLGAPLQMAARYEGQRYLIGPEMFPVYWLVIERALGWAAAIYAIVSVVAVATGTPNVQSAVDALVRLPGVLLWVAAWVTLIFALIEYGAARDPQKWQGLAERASCFPKAEFAPRARGVRHGRRKRAFAHAVAEAVFGFLFLVWLLLIPQHPWLMMGPGAALWKALPYALAPVWMTFYWWVVAAHALQLVWLCVELARGTWQKKHGLRHAVVKAIELIPINVLLYAPGKVLLVLREPARDGARLGATLSGWNEGLHKAVLVIATLVAAQIVWTLVHLVWRRGRNEAQ